MTIVLCRVDAHEGTTMSTYKDEESYCEVLCDVAAHEGTTMTAYMKESPCSDVLGEEPAHGGMAVITIAIEKPYPDIDDMSLKEREVTPYEDLPCRVGDNDCRSLNEAVQSVRMRGTVIMTPESDCISIEDILNRVLVWESKELRLWPDLAVFRDMGIRRKLKRKPAGMQRCFDPASYAHLDDHCLYAVMFRSLTGETPSKRGIAWIRWKMISEWRSSDVSVREQVAMLEGQETCSV